MNVYSLFVGAFFESKHLFCYNFTRYTCTHSARRVSERHKHTFTYSFKMLCYKINACRHNHTPRHIQCCAGLKLQIQAFQRRGNWKFNRLNITANLNCHHLQVARMCVCVCVCFFALMFFDIYNFFSVHLLFADCILSASIFFLLLVECARATYLHCKNEVGQSKNGGALVEQRSIEAKVISKTNK